MALAFIFPGQGSQAVGMGQALKEAYPAAREVFEAVDEALGESLSRVMAEGPMEALTLTQNAQPAIMAVSIAAMRALKAEFGVDVSAARFVAGHSLGEYTALCAAGAISLPDAARLLRLRGRAMQQAVPVGEGAMAALLGAEQAQAEAAVAAGQAHGVVAIANDNAPGQIVISGAKAAVEAALEAAKEHGVRRAMMLSVSAPFHCALMAPAAEAMTVALKHVAIAAPGAPLVANVSAAPVTDPETIRALLVEQVTGRVRWRESIDFMHGDGVTSFAEAGAKVLVTMLRRHLPDTQGAALSAPDEIEAFAASLKG
ncbi:MAG: ACP S-malonyltransferase [Alphaproteobacteria bacterium]|nr:ACP S-malonyltransferase [Alphaproteobacteria bacterium]